MTRQPEIDDQKQAIHSKWRPEAQIVLFEGDNRQLLRTIPRESIQLVVTSPPYNVGKAYEARSNMKEYLEAQTRVIRSCCRVLRPNGSLCWQVGNHIASDGDVVPLDALLYPVFKRQGLVLRNRIIWHYGHGLHLKKRFSGRYETILWFTKDTADYYFDLDAVRVPQKYPGKRHYKGPRVGEYSGHPDGKNPGDFWDVPDDPGEIWGVPNVKANHVEKTQHPCQFPIALITRLVRALTPTDSWVLDPYLGVGSAACAAVLEGRRAAGAEISPEYAAVARKRLGLAITGQLPYRPVEQALYEPTPGSPLTVRLDTAAG